MDGPWLEFHWHPHDGSLPRLRLRLSRRSAQVLLGGLVGIGLLFPTSWLYLAFGSRSQELEEGRRVEVSRRSQLLARQDALRSELQLSGERLERLRDRIARVETLYNLVLPEASPFRPAPPPTGSRDRRIGGEELLETAERLAREVEHLRGRLDRLAAFEQQRPVEIDRLPIRHPLPGVASVLVGAFGPRRNPFTGELEFLPGVRLAAPRGALIRSAGAGRVTFTGLIPPGTPGELWRLGQLVAVLHREDLVSLYGHCGRILVREGMQVTAREVLAEVGDTGWTTAPQLHFELRRREGGRWVPQDPLLYWIGVQLPEGWNLRTPPADVPDLPPEVVR